MYHLVNRVNEPFVRSKMAVTLKVKPCLSNFRRGIGRQKEGTNVILSFMRPGDLFLIPLFLTNFHQFSKRG